VKVSIKREQWKACFPIAEREQGRCDSSKGNTFVFLEWDSLRWMMADG
jgi:hypothetical protein